MIFLKKQWQVIPLCAWELHIQYIYKTQLNISTGPWAFIRKNININLKYEPHNFCASNLDSIDIDERSKLMVCVKFVINQN